MARVANFTAVHICKEVPKESLDDGSFSGNQPCAVSCRLATNALLQKLQMTDQSVATCADLLLNNLDEPLAAASSNGKVYLSCTSLVRREEYKNNQTISQH